MKGSEILIGIAIGIVATWTAHEYILQGYCKVQANETQCYNAKHDVVFSLEIIGGDLEDE